MQAIIDAVTSWVYTPAGSGTAAGGMVTYVGQWVDTIVSSPLLLAFAVIPLVGFGVGLLRRLININ